MNTNPDDTDLAAAEFAERVRDNQRKLGAELQPRYDFIVCGSGSSGSVVARCLAENAAVSVLLLEAGGDDDVPEVMRAEQWPLNLGSERDWNFSAQPNPHLNGRAIPFGMGKVLGGGSSINVMARASPPPVNGDPISPSLIGTISTSRQELPLRPDERQRIPPRRPRPSW